MARYIDAEKLINKIDAYVINNQDVMFIRQLIAQLETEDVAPVIHGHWVYQGLSPYNCFSRCSCCDVVFDGYETLEYCPKCGAKMDEEVTT